MNIDELRESMITLDNILAKNKGSEIALDTPKCSTAQKRIYRRFIKAAYSCFVLAVVYTILWLLGQGDKVFSPSIRVFLSVYLLAGAAWYFILSLKTKKIDLITMSPVTAMKDVATLRLMTLCGEIVLAIGLAVFFTLFLTNLMSIEPRKCWIVLSALAVMVGLSVTLYIPKAVRDFKDLTALK